jgi:hypothetical protein
MVANFADSHKNKKWQPYAAATAVAYMKELLSVIPPKNVAKVSPATAVEGKCRPREATLTAPDTTGAPAALGGRRVGVGE